MTEKQRLLDVLNGKDTDRPPVICPGGMMNAAVTEVVEGMKKNHNCDIDAMVEAAIKVHEITGFENYGVPFCMTIESEPFHVEVDLGSKLVEPRITKYNEDILNHLDEIKLEHSKRAITVLEAISRLKNNEIPVIGNITGPMSVVTSVIEPTDYYKMMRKDKVKAMKFLDIVTDYLIRFSMEMIENGADLIAMSDPSATGEILGKKNFEEFMIPMYKKISEAVHEKGVKIIIHICGKSQSILESLNDSGADSLSFDSAVGIRQAKEVLRAPIMGNVSTQLLDQGMKEKVKLCTEIVMKNGTSIVSPACGLAMSTPIENLKAMTDTVKNKG
ncbi:uroporphyrinogen decarboxylase [Psychrilyobacter piezotolerans]|uniref:Uroporphyrinogen decarboxylase n=1 Tax=Psychrilyobacter piezotolerans TaxID=2293438 RepID=A0ABX9KGA0_9FUSO|nr:uroporphyrinogen decarboxylase [Psychrilyobacter piezotolerans]RDE60331.1 uroporphyrinogen decarboxylase [Psychrilyobacter sp. S5]REI40439.1 uroporphyrinogen decarboxylase [Psychrilyobacter piezotolerans]